MNHEIAYTPGTYYLLRWHIFLINFLLSIRLLPLHRDANIYTHVKQSVFIFKVCYRHFRFKSWFVPAIQVRILNGLYVRVDRFVGWKWLERKTVRGMKAVKVLRHLSLGKTFVSCLVGRSFATVFLYETRDVCIVEGMIHSVAAHIRSFARVWV